MKELTSEMRGKLLEAIVDAYGSEGNLAIFLRVRLNKQLYHLVPNTELPVMVCHLIEKSEREGWREDLIQAQDVERSENRKVAAFYQAYHSLLKEQEEQNLVPTKSALFEKNRLTISLLDLMGSETGWGHERGASVTEIIRSHIEASHALIVRLSLQGVERMDVTYAGELVRLANQERMHRGFCLVDLTDQDLLTNWHAAAQSLCQPLGVWNDGALLRQLGPLPSIGLREMQKPCAGAASFTNK